MAKKVQRDPNRDEYADSYVAFVDILGFGDLVRAADTAPSLRSEIIEALRKVRQLPRSLPSTALRAHNFSDSLILSTDPSAEGLWRLILSLDALSWSLLQIGVLARGAIARGGVHHDERIVFGVGVNEAYRLESAVAKYPRIILGRKVVEDAILYGGADATWESYRRSRLLRDFDGVTFIHYLNDVAAANLHSRSALNADEDTWGIAGRKVQAIIQQKVDETLDSPHVYEKVRWLGKYWNATVVANATSPASAAFGPVTLAGEEARGPTLPFRSFP